MSEPNDTTPAARGQGHAVLRVARDCNFKTINLLVVQDMPGLSWGAKGLHTYLVTRPDGWIFRIDDLRKRARNGRDALYGLLRELETASLLYRGQARGEHGRMEPQQWTIYETPSNDPTASWKPVSGEAVSGETASGEPDASIEKGSIEGVEHSGEKTAARESVEMAAVRTVFQDWQEVTGRHRHKLTEPHKAKIRARYRDGFTIEHLRLATRGAWGNRWMRGDNDRETDYTYPRTIFRDAECVERHIRHARRTLPAEPWWPVDGVQDAVAAPPPDDMRIRAADIGRLFPGGVS